MKRISYSVRCNLARDLNLLLMWRKKHDCKKKDLSLAASKRPISSSFKRDFFQVPQEGLFLTASERPFSSSLKRPFTCRLKKVFLLPPQKGFSLAALKGSFSDCLKGTILCQPFIIFTKLYFTLPVLRGRITLNENVFSMNSVIFEHLHIFYVKASVIFFNNLRYSEQVEIH